MIFQQKNQNKQNSFFFFFFILFSLGKVAFFLLDPMFGASVGHEVARASGKERGGWLAGWPFLKGSYIGAMQWGW